MTDDLTPAETLRAAAQRLKDAQAAKCQSPGCEHADELHREDPDGIVWCKDCGTMHDYEAAPGADVPGWLAGPVAAWLEEVAFDAERYAAQHFSNHQEEVTDGHPMAVAEAILRA